MPDEAALTWPENIGPAALPARARRLAIAPHTAMPPKLATATTATTKMTRMSPSRPGSGASGTHRTRSRDQGGTIHQFPPPTGTR